MEDKMGRPTDNPKTIVKRARMSEDNVRQLKECCEYYNKNESEVLRMAIEKLHSAISK